VISGVTSTFKSNLRNSGRQISSYFTIGESTIPSSDIRNVKRYYNGQLFKSIMKCIEFEYTGSIDISNQPLGYNFGVKGPSDPSYEYITLGNYKLIPEIPGSIEDIIDRNSKKMITYDKMVESMVQYIPFIENWENMTVLTYLQAICGYFGWTLATTTFPNSDLPISEDYFGNTDALFRDALDKIAGTVGGVIFFDTNDEVVVKVPTLVENEKIGPSGISKLIFGDEFGPINRIVLSELSDDEGNTTGDVFQEDENSINENGLTEIKIVGNEILNADRATSIWPLFNALNGIIMYPVEIDSWGFIIYEPGDIIMAKDLNGVEHPVLILESEITITTGLKEKLYSTITKYATTNYEYAEPANRMLNQALIEIKKNAAQIKATAKKTDETGTKTDNLEINFNSFKNTVEETYETINGSEAKKSALEQSVDNLKFNLSGTGGINDKKNSSGQFGTRYHTVENVEAVADNNVSSGYAFQHHNDSFDVSDKFTPRKTKELVGGQYVDSPNYFISWNVRNELEFGKLRLKIRQYINDVIEQEDSIIIDKNSQYEIKSILVQLISNVMDTIEETIGENLTYDQAVAPASPSQNDTWHNTSTDVIAKYDGSSWVNTNLNYATDVVGGVISPKGYARVAECMCAGGSIYRNWQSAPGEYRGRDFQWNEDGFTIADNTGKKVNLDVSGLHGNNGFEETFLLTPDEAYSKNFRMETLTNGNIMMKKIAGGTGFYYTGGGE
jgi:hypothetical protein